MSTEYDADVLPGVHTFSTHSALSVMSYDAFGNRKARRIADSTPWVAARVQITSQSATVGGLN
jgi:YD repeat-containing protein